MSTTFRKSCTIKRTLIFFYNHRLLCLSAVLHASAAQLRRVLVGPGHPGHPAVQRRRHLARHGRLPVFGDADLPLGELQVSDLSEHQSQPSQCVSNPVAACSFTERSLMRRNKLYIGNWNSQMVIILVSSVHPASAKSFMSFSNLSAPFYL